VSHARGTPDMGVNLWGASPLYENGSLIGRQYPDRRANVACPTSKLARRATVHFCKVRSYILSTVNGFFKRVVAVAREEGKAVVSDSARQFLSLPCQQADRETECQGDAGRLRYGLSTGERNTALPIQCQLIEVPGVCTAARKVTI
jgi:hypothetical protein